MSIRFRLILALGVLLIATIGAMIAALLLDARHRVRDEVMSSMRVTEALLRSSLESLRGAPDANGRVSALVENLQQLRHVRISIANTATEAPQTKIAERAGGLDFFAPPETPPVEIPVVMGDAGANAILLEARPDDEMGEVWETIGRVSLYALALAAGGFALTSLLITRALAPVRQLERALHLLEEGDYSVSLPQSGPPEIAAIGKQVNALAAALNRARDENRTLSAAIVRVQDEERQDVARELHDELGPYLFSIRASASALARAFDGQMLDRPAAIRLAGDVQQHVDALQATNRRILQQLSPIGLDELGLARALEAIVNVRRALVNDADCEITLDARGNLDALDRTVALTVYRTVQEGLTNALRHAGASRIELEVAVGEEPAEAPANGGGVRIAVRDNGVGMPDELLSGHGLKGMRERIGALGGRLTISESPGGGGVELTAHLPDRLAQTTLAARHSAEV